MPKAVFYKTAAAIPLPDRPLPAIQKNISNAINKF